MNESYVSIYQQKYTTKSGEVRYYPKKYLRTKKTGRGRLKKPFTYIREYCTKNLDDNQILELYEYIKLNYPIKDNIQKDNGQEA